MLFVVAGTHRLHRLPSLLDSLINVIRGRRATNCLALFKRLHTTAMAHFMIPTGTVSYRREGEGRGGEGKGGEGGEGRREG